MKGKIIALCLTMFTVGLSGCATPLNSGQKQELSGYQNKGLAIEEKNPAAAAALGVLPGFGSFYTGNAGPGIINLLLWPSSILWDPVSGYDGALVKNYYATKMAVERKQKKEVSTLDDELVASTISKEEYVQRKRAIEAKYSPD